MNSVRLNSLSLKYNWFTPSGCKDIEIRTFEFVANTQFLYNPFNEMDLCFPKVMGLWIGILNLGIISRLF